MAVSVHVTAIKSGVFNLNQVFCPRSNIDWDPYDTRLQTWAQLRITYNYIVSVINQINNNTDLDEPLFYDDHEDLFYY